MLEQPRISLLCVPVPDYTARTSEHKWVEFKENKQKKRAKEDSKPRSPSVFGNLFGELWANFPLSLHVLRDSHSKDVHFSRSFAKSKYVKSYIPFNLIQWDPGLFENRSASRAGSRAVTAWLLAYTLCVCVCFLAFCWQCTVSQVGRFGVQASIFREWWLKGCGDSTHSWVFNRTMLPVLLLWC